MFRRVFSADFFRACAAIFGLLLVLVPGVASATEPVPHHAHYRLDLLELRQGSAVEAGGDLEFRIERTCEGWRLDKKLFFAALDADGDGTRIEIAERITESLNGRELEFSNIVMLNGEVLKSGSGTARIGSDGGRGQVNLHHPEAATLALPEGTVFTVMATRRMLAAFAAGERLITQIVFTGHEMQPQRHTDLIAGTPAPVETPPGGDAVLLQGSPQRMVTALFPLEKADSEPLATYIFDFYTNGVIGRLTLDFGIMSIEGILTEIKRLPDPAC